MSGGSWDYLCYRMDDAADRLECSKDPLRRVLSAHMRKIAKAMHDIEWVDSYDYAPGDEVDAIRAVIGVGGDADDGSESMSSEGTKPGEVEDFVPIERIPTADELAEMRDAMERLRGHGEAPLPPEERSRKELMDLRQRFQTWSRQQHGSLDGCLHSIAVESELPDGVTLPMVAESALREIVALRATLERVRKLPEHWRTDPRRRRCLSPTEEAQLGLCADELEQALEGEP